MKKIIGKIIFSLLLNLFPKGDHRKLHKNVGIVSLLCHKDVELFIYNLSSLFYWLNFQLPIFVVDDGSLTEKDQKILKRFFHIQIEKKLIADQKMKVLLKPYPHLFKHRFSYTKRVFKMKLDTLLLNPFKKFIFLDADLLFHQYPKEIDDWISNQTTKALYTAHITKRYEEEYFPEYSLRKLLYLFLNIKMSAGFSSGLMAIPSKSFIHISQMEKLFKLYNRISTLHNEALEESAFSVFMANNAKCLNLNQYIVLSLFSEYLDTKDQIPVSKMVHYGWETKNQIFPAGIKLAIKESFFR